MAPEHLQAFGADVPHVDVRSDLYSLGVILYELLTGRRPHPYTPDLQPEAGVRSRLIAQRQVLPPPPSTINPSIPPSVDAIVLKLLEPSPARRYQNADDLHSDLTRQLAHQPLRYVRSRSIRERMHKWRRRNPRLATGLAVAALALVVLILPAGMIAAEQVRQTRNAELQKSEALNAHAIAMGEGDRSRLCWDRASIRRCASRGMHSARACSNVTASRTTSRGNRVQALLCSNQHNVRI